MQTSRVVKAFYECLARGEEYTDTAWDDWQKLHPSSAPTATQAGQGGNSRMTQRNAADPSAQGGYRSSAGGAGSQQRGGNNACFK